MDLNSLFFTQQSLQKRLMNLAMGRVYKSLHSKLSGEEKLEKERIFEFRRRLRKGKVYKKTFAEF